MSLKPWPRSSCIHTSFSVNSGSLIRAILCLPRVWVWVYYPYIYMFYFFFALFRPLLPLAIRRCRPKLSLHYRLGEDRTEWCGRATIWRRCQVQTDSRCFNTLLKKKNNFRWDGLAAAFKTNTQGSTLGPAPISLCHVLQSSRAQRVHLLWFCGALFL